MPASNYVQCKTLDGWLCGQDVTFPPVGYLALYTTNPTAADSGTEVTGGGYVRMPAQFTQAASQGEHSVTQNANKVEFPEATEPWGRVAYFGIRDAETGGNLLYFSPLTTSFDVVSGTAPKFEAGAITVTLE